MRTRRSLVLLAIGVLGGLAACMSSETEVLRGGGSEVNANAFDKNAVLDDVSLRDSEAMTEDDVQRFLEKTPWGTASALATYEENGKSAAQIIHASATKHGINPLELLVRAQMEQGLISKKTAPESTIAIAFGCGCPHSPACSDKYRGLENQAECAAGTLSRSMEAALTATGTVSGWARNQAKTTQDGISVTPKNTATAALYTYTPWVGEAGGGRDGIGGVSLHHAVWNRFATAVGYGAWASADVDASSSAPPPPEEEPAADAGASSRRDAATPAPRDAGSGALPSSDAGAPPSQPPSQEKNRGAPTDGSEDSDVLGEGNAPPAANFPAPKSSSPSGRSSKKEETEASEEELSSKRKTTGGCAASGAHGGSDVGMIAIAAVASIVGSRRGFSARRDRRRRRA